MTIRKDRDGDVLTIVLEGEITAVTAPELNEVLTEAVQEDVDIIIDMEQVPYIASAGMRVLLTAQKQKNKNRRLVLRRIRPDIMEIFEVTGMTECLTIEE